MGYNEAEEDRDRMPWPDEEESEEQELARIDAENEVIYRAAGVPFVPLGTPQQED